MWLKQNFTAIVPYLLLQAILFVIANVSFAQSSLKGRIVAENDQRPIPFASVGIKGKKAGCISDASGNFRISFPNFVKETDTLIISSIGFENILLPLKTALSQSEFQLIEKIKSLPEITMYSFRKLASIGSYTIHSIFRAWYEYKTGGEIGTVFHFPYKKYKIESVIFKVDNKCDTCWIRLHIRKVVNKEPADELLTKNIIIPVTASSFYDAAPEFILHDDDIVLSEDDIFIGFEVLQCTCESEKNFSISFSGTEYGSYYYKSFTNSPWEKENYNGLYMRITLKY